MNSCNLSAWTTWTYMDYMITKLYIRATLNAKRSVKKIGTKLNKSTVIVRTSACHYKPTYSLKQNCNSSNIQILEFGKTRHFFKQPSEMWNCIKFQGFNLKNDFGNAKNVKTTLVNYAHKWAAIPMIELDRNIYLNNTPSKFQNDLKKY